MPAIPSFTDEQLLAAGVQAGLLPADVGPDALTPVLRNELKRRMVAETAPPAPTTARTLAALHRELLDEDLPEQLAAAIVLEAARLEVRRLHLATAPTTP